MVITHWKSAVVDQGNKYFVFLQGDRFTIRCGQYGHHDAHGHSCPEQTG